MAVHNKTICDLVILVKSWMPFRSEPATLSRDFWMPDQSCRVCYECDAHFTVINRRHHCRLCGRIFCAKCTEKSIPVSPGDPSIAQEEWCRIRVCNFCFKQWQQGIVTIDNGLLVVNQDLTSSSSPTGLVSPKSSGTTDSSTVTLDSSGSYQQVQHSSGSSLHQTSIMETNKDRQGAVDLATDTRDLSPRQYIFSLNRSDDEDDEYNVYQSYDEPQHFPQVYGQVEFDETGYESGLHKDHQHEENSDPKNLCDSTAYNSFNSRILEEIHQHREKDEHDAEYECEAPSSSMYDVEDVNIEPVDFENNGLLWLPPEPEDGEDEKEDFLFDDDDDDDGDGIGELGYFRHSSSFGSGEHRQRSSEGNKKAMKNVVDGHFRALVSQLLQVENLPMGEEDDQESWLEIITSLSWEAATLLKPDTSEGGGMDPGGYVKVKCIASGHRRESMVVKGVVCKKNVAHRRMISKIGRPSMLILGGALEYQRVSNLLSSFDTLLQQEMDHLKMAVAKIDAHRPDILLVEKSVSRFAQEYLLEKDISLVLNIKRPLLERIARCTGAEIVPSIDHLSSPRLGHCENFHVTRFLEEHGSAGQSGKKLVKTLMYFEGCPKPLGCTILLRGANGDELKKVKHVVQYGIFAAYHLALETSFLADEGASLPELPFNTPITMGLPDKSLSIERSISTIPGFSISPSKNPQPDGVPSPFLASSINSTFLDKIEKTTTLPCFPNGGSFRLSQPAPSLIEPTSTFSSVSPSAKRVQDTYHSDLLSPRSLEEKYGVVSRESLIAEASAMNNCEAVESVGQDGVATDVKNHDSSVMSSSHQEPAPLKEEFPQAPDNQSILVSLSSRCVWKGTVCERSHLFRIKYYGNFDKPLGRFLRDYLFDQNYRCGSCEMPTEAHVHCYTHRQGTLTISVKKLPEILLPGEREGKIWMWHRCLRCPRIDGFPPATRRIVMSDAAWGLSFGKFLELSFSNHAAATRVASCGHSLHRDCLRFYGFGTMVACFRYASIDVHSVYLPPFKLHFSSENQEWMQKEVDEVVKRAELLFYEVLSALGKIRSVTGPCQVSELEGMLQREKVEFEESLQKILKKEAKKGLPTVDILEINRMRRQILFQSYMWDHRLVYVANSENNRLQDSLSCSVSDNQEKPPNEKASDTYVLTKSTKSLGAHSVLVDTALTKDFDSNARQLGVDYGKEETDTNTGEQCDSMESGVNVRRALSEGQFPIMANLSDTLDAAWIGETTATTPDGLDVEDRVEERNGQIVSNSLSHALSSKESDNLEESVSWLGMPFLNFYRAFNKNFLSSSQKLDTLGEYKPVYVSSFRKSELQGGGRLLLPVGVNDTVVPVFDDEPTSIIAYALASPDYYSQLSDEADRPRDGAESFSSSLFTDTSSLISAQSLDESITDSFRSFGLVDDGILSMTGSRSSLGSDPISHTKSAHVRVSFSDDGLLGNVKYTVTCYYAKRFEALRKICCPSELDFIRSLSRCKKWGAQGGKSNVFFAKTLDDRFIIKQVTKTELESFIKFAPSYFKYLSESISTRSPTCLAKIMGIYQVTTKHVKGGKETRMDVLVMENLLFGRTLSRLYDLKGSSRSRYNADSSGSNKVLLDQNLIEAMPTSPIFVGNKAKRLLERAVWNDTSFLASVDVMDYSLLVGVDEEKHELVLGIIDFMRQYTWDKHLETWVKASGILGGPKNASPTVISPKQYKKRFRKAMTTYFLMLPDQWSPPIIIPSRSQSEFCDDNNSQTPD